MLRERVTLQQETRTSDSQGGYTVAWSDVATVWAQVRPIRSSERLWAAQQADVRLYEIKARMSASVVPQTSWRAVWRGKNLSITGVEVSEDRRWYMLTCQEGEAV